MAEKKYAKVYWQLDFVKILSSAPKKYAILKYKAKGTNVIKKNNNQKNTHTELITKSIKIGQDR